MSDSFVCAVVHIYEKRFPLFGKRGCVYCESVVLRCDETSVGADFSYWLVMAAVSIFQFECLSAGGFSQQLVTHAYTTDRLTYLDSLAYVLDCFVGVIWVARTV